MTKLIVAVDTPDRNDAERLLLAVKDHVDAFKVGMVFFAANGLAGVARLQRFGIPLMLDLKLHDIPTTVSRAVRALLPLRPCFLTVHASGGRAMVEAARVATEDAYGYDRPFVLAVVALTSLSHGYSRVLDAIWDADNGGADGIVCPVGCAASVKANARSGMLLVCPGIRLYGQSGDDHRASAPPGDAVKASVDYVVVGRPIAQAADPAAAAAAIVADMREEARA